MSWRHLFSELSLLLPAWWVWNPGQGGGGGGTVHTDGVTIQGDGSSGSPIAIKQVEHNSTLTGGGTVASPLGVLDWPTPYVIGSGGGAGTFGGGNSIDLFSFSLPNQIRFSTISVFITTTDNASNADVGIYDAAGNLVADVGAQAFPTIALSTFNCAQGTVTLPPGFYVFAFTCETNQVQMAYDNNTIAAISRNGFGTSVGGQLPATLALPAILPDLGGPNAGLF